jgi:hypothetical protein
MEDDKDGANDVVSKKSSTKTIFGNFRNWYKNQPSEIKNAIILGIFTVIAAFITGCFLIFQTFISSNTISKKESPIDKYLIIFPTIGAQLDFSLTQGSPSDYSNNLQESPFSGIYLSNLDVNMDMAPSWIVFYPNGKSKPAETDICLTNIAKYVMLPGSPLNAKVSEISLYIKVFTDYRYSFIVESLDLIVVDYLEQSNLFYDITIGVPGAGGQSGTVRIVRTPRQWLSGEEKTYNINFKDFKLEPNNGVSILIPITMEESGDYQFQLKIRGRAIPNYSEERKGDLILTSDIGKYGWVKIDDPRNYNLTAQGAQWFPTGTPFPDDYETVNVVPCK